MKRRIYNSPEMELLSLLHGDIITQSWELPLVPGEEDDDNSELPFVPGQ